MKITVIGTGSHAAAICDSIRQLGEYQVEGLLSETIPVGEKSCGLPVIGNPNSKEWLHLMSFIAIGDNEMRERFSQLGYQFINVVHPSAQIGKVMCCGTFFGANSFVGSGARVGNFCIVNTGVILEHDCSVGDFSHLAPGVTTGGKVTIGSGTTIGLNSTIRDGISVGSNCIIGMGSALTRSIPDNSIAWGNPCRIIKKK